MVSEKVELKRQLGVLHGVGICFGLVVGSGIYITPSGVIQNAGSPALCLILWSVAGVMSTIGTLCMAELGTTYPKSGERYAYLGIMYGPKAAYAYLWTYMLGVRCPANVMKALILAQSIMTLFFADCEMPSTAVTLIAIFIQALLTFLNCLSVKWSARTQATLTMVSVGALSVISVIGFVYLGQGKFGDLEFPWEGTSTSGMSIAVALTTAIYAFGGGSALNYLVEEVKRPSRTLPLSISISMTLVIVLYVSVNLAYLVVMGPREMLQSQAVAVTFAQKTIPQVAWLMTICISLNLASSFNSGLLVGSRLCFVGSRSGQFPQALSLVHIERNTPISSLIFQLILQAALTGVADFNLLFRNAATVNILFNVMVISAMVKMRFTHKDLLRPFKVPLLFAILYLVCMVYLLVVKTIMFPVETFIGVTVILIFTTVMYYSTVVNKAPKIIQRWSEKITTATQKILFACPAAPDVDF
ncbi:hypothetical protein CAPTEDRAFT_171724 [Capitella teleta]|uniref:Amino acid permease/ SLC12A domain-containing protein n=1 Tax=Capitella teleta TaxID=283909 RepID=R7T890_CAPTE|nr:hypothetical protein CAPTEDRAFT_171724 [Capitella teleta]|eukprot:ELT87189.1 hypothetical protein CAPTEDRAFT_171724 [Capitella teleta]